MTKQRTGFENFSDQQLTLTYRQSQDPQCVAVLYERYAHLILGMCRKYVDPVEAEDLSMSVFEILLTQLKSNPVDNFATWVYVVVRNECLKYLRSKSNQQTAHNKYLATLDEGTVTSGQGAASPTSLIEAFDGDLNLYLNQLKPDQKRCLEMFYFDQCSYRQISEATGMSYTQVKSHLQNGIRKLQVLLRIGTILAPIVSLIF